MIRRLLRDLEPGSRPCTGDLHDMKLRTPCARAARVSSAISALLCLGALVLFVGWAAPSAHALPSSGDQGGVGGGGGGVGGSPISGLSSEAIGTLPGFWAEEGDFQVVIQLGTTAWLQYASLSTTVIVPSDHLHDAVLSAVGDGFVLLNHVKGSDRVRARFYGNVRVSFASEWLLPQGSITSTVGYLYNKAPAAMSFGPREMLPVTMPSTGSTVGLWSNQWNAPEQAPGKTVVQLYAQSKKGFSARQAIVPVGNVVWAYQHVL